MQGGAASQEQKAFWPGEACCLWAQGKGVWRRRVYGELVTGGVVDARAKCRRRGLLVAWWALGHRWTEWTRRALWRENVGCCYRIQTPLTLGGFITSGVSFVKAGKMG